MKNKEFAEQLERRTKEFAYEIVSLSSRLPKTIESNVIRRQLTRAGTSIGANYCEANRARSRSDFRNRIKICESEANETRYWLELVMELGWPSLKQVNPIYQECKELLAIFSKISIKCSNVTRFL